MPSVLRDRPHTGRSSARGAPPPVPPRSPRSKAKLAAWLGTEIGIVVEPEPPLSAGDRKRTVSSSKTAPQQWKQGFLLLYLKFPLPDFLNGPEYFAGSGCQDLKVGSGSCLDSIKPLFYGFDGLIPISKQFLQTTAPDFKNLFGSYSLVSLFRFFSLLLR